MKTFFIEYPWRDGMYLLQVPASDEVEAKERVRQAANLGRCFTPHGAEPLAINTRWYANLVVWWRNVVSRS